MGHLTCTPSSSSRLSVACLSIMLKKMLKRVGARTRTLLHSISDGNCTDRSPLRLICPCWFLCNWITICRKIWGQPCRFGLCHVVDKCSIESLFLFLAFFLELTEGEHHVYRASVDSEGTLALREVFISDGWNEPVEQAFGKYFIRSGE